MEAELNYQRLRRIVRALTLPAGHPPRGKALLNFTVSRDQVGITSGTPDLFGRVRAHGGRSDGHTTVDLTEFTRALNAVAPGRRGAASPTVRLHAEHGQLRMHAGSTAVVAHTDAVQPPTMFEGGNTLITIPVRDWLAAVAAVVIAAETKRQHPRYLRAIRLWRDAGCCLALEATDTYRAHRIVVGEPAPDTYEARLPSPSTRAVAGLLGLAPDNATVHIVHCGELLVWDADTVTVAARTTGETSWPELERVFETVADADLTFITNLTAMNDSVRRAAAVAAGTTPVDLDIDPAAPTLTITVPGPVGQPPRMHLPVEIHTARGPALHTKVIAEHLLHLVTAAGADDATMRVSTTSNLLGITRGRFTGAVIHTRRGRDPSTSDMTTLSEGGEA